MSKMKEVICAIVEDFQDRMPMTLIAEEYNVPVSFVQEVIREYGEGPGSTVVCGVLQ